jgi:predicted ATPase/class 3 adenylate cyclase
MHWDDICAARSVTPSDRLGPEPIAESGAVLLAVGSQHGGSATAAEDLMDLLLWRAGEGRWSSTTGGATLFVVTEVAGTRTFLFTDIESSTALWDSEPAAMSKALLIHDELLRAAIVGQRGSVFSTAGDGLGAVFGSAPEAMVAAIDAQRAFEAVSWPTTVRLRVRMGVHTGAAEERDGDYLGPSVNRAARVMGLARGGQILVSLSSKKALCDAEFEFVDGGEYRLKGFAEPERIFALSMPGLDDEPPSGLARRVRPPRPLTRLIGRDAEVVAIAAAMADSPLVTLTGVGGVGKTRLALAVTERVSRSFSEGEFWIELAHVSEHTDAVAAIAAALGIRPNLDIGLVDQIADAVSDRRVLIALDNCEHVAPAVRATVRTLLERCPRVGVLATSRERLGVPGERVTAVAPLPADDPGAAAVLLLAERIDDGGSAEAAGVGALLEIARRVDGLPLALELAAARCRTLGPAEVAARLDELSFLTDRTRTDHRHQTLETVLAWSFDLLTEIERRVLERVSVFAGAFSLEAAEQVLPGDDLARTAVDDAIASLVDKSLLVRHAGRFRLLETTRQFAWRRLAHSGDEAVISEAHTRFVLDRAPVIRLGLRGRDEAKWVAVLDVEWPDVRATVRRALDSDDADTVITLVTQYALEIAYRRPEGYAWIAEAVRRYADRPGPHRHELLGAGAMAAFTRLDVSGGVELAERALAADPAPGTAVDFLPEVMASGAYAFAGRFDEGMEVLEHRLSALGDDADLRGRLLLANSAASLSVLSGSEEAPAVASRAVRMATLVGNPTGMAYALGCEAIRLRSVGSDRAVELGQRAHAFAEQVGNSWLLGGDVLVSLGGALEQAGSLDEALEVHLEATERTHDSGWRLHAWMNAWSIVTTLASLGRLEEAALLLGGCEASTTSPYPVQTLPPELEAIARGQGDARLLALRAYGATLSLPELIRIARGEREIPNI